MLLQKRVVCTKLDIYDFTWHFHQTVHYFTCYNLLNEFKLYNAPPPSPPQATVLDTNEYKIMCNL